MSKAGQKYGTREEWLGAAVEMLRPIFKARADVTLPKEWRVSCGFPYGGRKGRRIGECWAKSASKDAHWEMFVSPTLDAPVRVLGVLVHELTHAGVGVKEGHNKVFGKAARAMLLEGKLTATTEGKPFEEEIAKPVLARLGTYPHAELRPGGVSTGPKKQTARLLKAQCPECELVIRVTQKWLETGTPKCFNEECGNCGEDLKIEQ